MKVLTVYQPWTSLIIVGAKPFEFRKWSLRERGGAYAALIGQRIGIHASARKIDPREVYGIIRKLEAGGDLAASTCLHAELAMPILERALQTHVTTERGIISLDGHGDLPWSATLGTAVIGEPRDGIDIAVKDFGWNPPPPEPIGFNPHSGAENPFGDEDDDDDIGGFDSDRKKQANFGWPMLDVERWDMPVPMRGAQGFWHMPSPAGVGL